MKTYIKFWQCNILRFALQWKYMRIAAHEYTIWTREIIGNSITLPCCAENDSGRECKYCAYTAGYHSWRWGFIIACSSWNSLGWQDERFTEGLKF